VLGEPMSRYLRGSHELNPDDMVNVREIDVLNLVADSEHCDVWYGRPCAMFLLGGPLPQELATRFVLVEQRRVQDFRIDRYVSGRPVPLQARGLVDTKHLSTALMVFVPAR
jgi:hypothetical protein